MTQPNRIDPAAVLGLRATFSLDELREIHDDAVNEQDSVTHRDAWLRLVDVLFAAAYPRDVHHCTGGCKSAPVEVQS
ncbi:hypothetical protein ABZ814_22690 [Micromonospora musae]|uniref:hypothetical protein n=1 Tax=Micromonospora musae TaxID=1894970 RepID=UPI00340692C6